MTKIKGLLKGIKLISQIFAYKEHEMEIGYPTDVKHVAHIGWDNNESGNSPSWMNEFKTASEFSSASLSNFDQQKENPLFEGKQETPWVRKDFDQPNDLRPVSALLAEVPCSDKPKTPKKVKQKKIKASSTTAPSISPRGHKTRGFRGRASSEEQMELWTKFK